MVCLSILILLHKQFFPPPRHFPHMLHEWCCITQAPGHYATSVWYTTAGQTRGHMSLKNLQWQFRYGNTKILTESICPLWARWPGGKIRCAKSWPNQGTRHAWKLSTFFWCTAIFGWSQDQIVAKEKGESLMLILHSDGLHWTMHLYHEHNLNVLPRLTTPWKHMCSFMSPVSFTLNFNYPRLSIHLGINNTLAVLCIVQAMNEVLNIVLFKWFLLARANESQYNYVTQHKDMWLLYNTGTF